MKRLTLPFLLLLLHMGAPRLHAQIVEQSQAVASRSVAFPVASPLVIQEGRDPLHPALLYQGSSGRGRIGFLRDGVRLGFRRGKQEMIVGLTFEEANGGAHIAPGGDESNRARIRTLRGSGARSTALVHYSEIGYHDIYDGIDIRYYGAEGSLKYDCLVEPGADPARIRMRYDGVDRLELNSAGDLEIVTSWGRLAERHPYVYQIVDGKHREVAAEFRLLDGKSFGFEIGDYDRTLPLVIDPMILGWSTFVGGGNFSGGFGDGYLFDMTVDAAGDIYCTGWYNETFPTTPGVYDIDYNGGVCDAYLFKLSSDGRRLIFATLIGGQGREAGHAITLGPDNAIYIGGQTNSDDFPLTPGAYNGGAKGLYDCFIMKLSNDGTTLLYSARFGGIGIDTTSRIAVDASGAATIVGITQGDGYPTTPGAYDESFSSNGAASDIFVTRLSPDGSSLIFSTYIGGTLGDFGADLVVEPGGETLVTGSTYSPDFPTTTGTYDETRNGASSDAFLLRLSADGRRLLYSTLFGGTSNDVANALSLGVGDRVVLAGYSQSDDMPTTPGAFDPFYASGRDGFVAIFAENGSRLVAASYAGTGGSADELQDVVVDDDGTIYVAGRTESYDAFTAACPINGESHGLANLFDVYVMRLSADLARLRFGDFIGGQWNDYGTRLALHPDRCRRELTVSVTSHSIDFPTTADAYQPNKLNGDEDQPTVMKIRPTIRPAFRSTTTCSSVSFTDITAGECIWGDSAWVPTTWLWEFGDGTTSSEQNPTHHYPGIGTYTVTLHVGCPRDSATGTVTITEAVVASPDQTICGGDSVQLSASGGLDYFWSPTTGLSCIDCASPVAMPPSTTTYVVRTSGGCDDTVVVNVIPRFDVTGSPDTTICLGRSVQLEGFGAADLLWSPADGLSCTSCVSPVATPLRTTTYHVKSTGADERCSTSDSLTITVIDPKRMRAHIDRGFLAAPGDTVRVPMVLDDPGDAAPITSLRVTLRYDSAMMRLINVSPFASDSLLYGSMLADWLMTVDTLRHGIFSALFVAPPGADAITGGGRLLYLRFLTFVRPNATPATPWSDSSSIPFDLVAVENLCSDAAGDSGLVRLELCGLATRLIAMGAEKYSLSIAPSNPFRGPLTIDFTLGLDGPTRVEVFDLSGRRVATLIDRHLDEGHYSMTWDAPWLPSGVYYLRLVSGEWSQTSSMIKTE